MRDIKFRAWDKQYKKMDNVIMFLFDKNEIDIASNFGEQKNIDNFELMQYTGIKDKNGKEIYEGDLCSYFNPYNKKTYVREVKFCSMFACFGLFQKDGNIYDYESDWLKIVDIEVIGNIYENKELLP